MPKVIIDVKKCKSCYICVEACPKKVLKVSEKIGKTGNGVVEFVDIDNKCIGCALCARSCPDLAITEVIK